MCIRDSLIGVQYSLPAHAFLIIPREDRRRLAVLIKSEMLVIAVDVWEIEVRVILPMKSIGGFVLIRPLVLIGHAIHEEPVGDRHFLHGLDQLAVQSSDTLVPITILAYLAKIGVIVLLGVKSREFLVWAETDRLELDPSIKKLPFRLGLRMDNFFNDLAMSLINM